MGKYAWPRRSAIRAHSEICVPNDCSLAVVRRVGKGVSGVYRLALLLRTPYPPSTHGAPDGGHAQPAASLCPPYRLSLLSQRVHSAIERPLPLRERACTTHPRPRLGEGSLSASNACGEIPLTQANFQRCPTCPLPQGERAQSRALRSLSVVTFKRSHAWSSASALVRISPGEGRFFHGHGVGSRCYA